MNTEIEKVVFVKDKGSSTKRIIYQLNIHGKQQIFHDTESHIFPCGIITLENKGKWYLSIVTHLILDQQFKNFILKNIIELEKLNKDDIIIL